jgi:heme-binding NEAT domain protein
MYYLCIVIKTEQQTKSKIMESNKELIKQLENELSFVNKTYQNAKAVSDALFQRQQSIEKKIESIKAQEKVVTYHELKAKHPDAILLFRCGDFYESYEEDAVAMAAILGITLNMNKPNEGGWGCFTGFPHHALDTYLPKLIRAGKRVAIADEI